MAHGARFKAHTQEKNKFCQQKEDKKMGKFQELKVWQRAKDLAVYIYRITGKGVFSKDFSLKDQIRRAAVSIPSNIAEGDDLGTDKQSVNYFYIARGSSAEVLTQAIISLEINYIDNDDFDHIENECKAISGMLTRLIRARLKK
jgi:four helix bundle protein